MDRMFQDAAGLTPAFEAGHPVGLVKRLAGTVDAAQATALSRPALGRWPKGAKARNLLRDSANPLSGLILPSASNVGVTATRSVVDGAVRVTLAGTPSVNQTVSLATSLLGIGATLAKAPCDFTSSVEYRIASGAELIPEGNFGVRLGLVGRNASNAYIEGGSGATARSTEWTRLTYSRAFTSPDFDRMTIYILFAFQSGVPVDGISFELRNPQLEAGLEATPYQPTDADGVPLAGYGQVRNLAGGSAVVDGTGPFWRSSPNVVTGITVQRVGSGIEGGLPYIDMRYSGTTPEGITAYVSAGVSQPVTSGNVATAQMITRIVAGSYDTNTSLFRILIQRAINGVVQATGAVAGNLTQTTGDEVHLVATLNPDLTINGVTSKVELRVMPNSTVDVTFRIKGYQFELGTVATPIQFNYGPNNITEQGVEDVWFLVNDGNDALPVSLPAGTYGVAWVNPAGGISYATQTLAAEGQIDALRGTRMCDVIIRQGDFTAAEKAIIEAEWSTIAA